MFPLCALCVLCGQFLRIRAIRVIRGRSFGCGGAALGHPRLTNAAVTETAATEDIAWSRALPYEAARFIQKYVRTQNYSHLETWRSAVRVPKIFARSYLEI